MATTPDPAPASPENPDAALIASLASGDPKAVTELYDAHATSLFSLALHIVGDQRDAEDVVEETFRQARTEAGRFDAARGSAGHWLLLITRRVAIDRVRSRAGGGQGADDATVLLPDPAQRRSFEVNTQDDADRLRSELLALPRLQRIAVELAYFESLSPTQIAERVEHPVAVVREKVRAALATLRSGLEAR